MHKLCCCFLLFYFLFLDILIYVPIFGFDFSKKKKKNPVHTAAQLFVSLTDKKGRRHMFRKWRWTITFFILTKKKKKNK